MKGQLAPILPPGLRGRARNPQSLAAFSADGRRILAAGQPGESGASSAELWLRDAATGAGLARLDNGASGVAAAAFADGGASAVAAGWDGRVARLDIAPELALPLDALIAYRAGGLERVLTIDEATEVGLEARGWNVQQGMPQSADAVARCDALAAHPMDLERRAPGVAWQFLDGARAARYCEIAAGRLEAEGDEGPDFARIAFQWGRALDRLGDTTAAQERYRLAAELGHAQAEASLALDLADARDADANRLAEAFRWAQSSADQGNASGMLEVATSLRMGRGVGADPVAARAWFQRAADLGQPQANERLADMLRKGEGGPADPAGALFRFALASKLWQASGEIDSANANALARALLEEELAPAAAGAILCQADAWQPEPTGPDRPSGWQRLLRALEGLMGPRGEDAHGRAACS
jgi:TPR repeat protein